VPKDLPVRSPASRPFKLKKAAELQTMFVKALRDGDGVIGAHCIHELWMRGEMAANIESMLERLWKSGSETRRKKSIDRVFESGSETRKKESILDGVFESGSETRKKESMLDGVFESGSETLPDWLPMRHIEWLPQVYDVAAQFKARAKGRSNIYLILLDYSDSRSDPHGIYVGMSAYSAADRFDQHKAGIRAAGSVLKRGLESLTGPVMHLQRIKRAEAERIEVELAEALTAAGLFVQGGH